MKKIMFFFPLVMAALILTVSCQEKIDDVVKSTADFESAYWDGLVDNPQYGGDLMYGPADENWCYNSNYSWADPITGLSFAGFSESWGSLSFSGGGEAVSNYVVADYSGADHNRQLEVPAAPKEGKTFIVHYGSGEPYPMMRISTGEEFCVESLDYIMTDYLADAAINGGKYFGPLTAAGSFIGVRMIGFDKEGNRCGSVEKVLVTTEDVALYKNDSKQIEWQKWDTSSLGYVCAVAFEVYGSSDCYGDFGFNPPAYFAYDNVVVLKKKID